MPSANQRKTLSATSPRKLSKRGAETEQKLLDAANEVFWDNGFAGAKIAQIVSASDLSVGSFYHLYSDKKDLLDRATERLIEDFHQAFAAIDLSREANSDFFTMIYRLCVEGRLLVGRHRGIYRATAELAQNDISGFGPLQVIVPTMFNAVERVMPDYADQLPPNITLDDVPYVMQLVSMTVLQTELGLGPFFPKDIETFARLIARAACGIVGYSGQTKTPQAGHLTKDVRGDH